MWLLGLALVLVSPWVSARGVVDNTGSVFSSTHRLSKLLDAERNAVQHMRRYISVQREGIARLKKIQQMIDAPQEAGLGSSIEHPVTAFHLVHHFVTHWKGIYTIVFNSTDHVAWRKKLRKGVHKLTPHARDLHGSFKSLVHLQSVYDLDPRDLAAGKIQGRNSQPMDQGDCYYMAQAALDYGLHKESLQWIRLATDKTVKGHEYRIRDRDVRDLEDVMEIYGEDRSKAHIENFLKLSLKKLENHELLKHAMETAKKLIEKASKEKTPDPVQLSEVQQTKQLNTRSGEHELRVKFRGTGVDQAEINKIQEYAAEVADSWEQNLKEQKKEVEEQQKVDSSHLCRGLKSGATSNAQLVCRYMTSDLLYNVWKEEIMHDEPKITMIHDFITEHEIQHLQDISESALKRAKTGSRSYDERVQSSCWHEDRNSTTVYKLSERASRLTGLDCLHWAEMWQVGQYGIGGRYGVHLDYDPSRFRHTYIRDRLMGDRLATLMIYLSDVEAGGFTVFPRLDVYVKPVKRSAVLWYNYKEDGHGDPRTLHAGCPVLLGHKWVANKWIHMYGNELNRPCRMSRVV